MNTINEPKINRKLMKVEIPRELYQAIVRIQAAESLDWLEACVRASLLLDANSETFKQAVEREAERRGKSRFMKQLNKARESIEANATKWAQFSVRTWEDNFHIPCSICGKPMSFSNRDQNWEKVKGILYEAFSNWHHTSCRNQ